MFCAEENLTLRVWSPLALTVRPWARLDLLTPILIRSKPVKYCVALITLLLYLSLKPQMLLGSLTVGIRPLTILCIQFMFWQLPCEKCSILLAPVVSRTPSGRPFWTGRRQFGRLHT